MKTAVEWLEIEIQKSIIPAQKDYFKWAFDQAKEMEKEYIVKAWWESPTIGKYCSAEQYYNETFKKQE